MGRLPQPSRPKDVVLLGLGVDTLRGLLNVLLVASVELAAADVQLEQGAHTIGAKGARGTSPFAEEGERILLCPAPNLLHRRKEHCKHAVARAVELRADEPPNRADTLQLQRPEGLQCTDLQEGLPLVVPGVSADRAIASLSGGSMSGVCKEHCAIEDEGAQQR